MQKHTLQRQKILEVFQNGDLLTAQELCERLPEIDRATIYRNLARFVEEGLLREVNVKKGISSYEINIKDDFHQHFICTNCNKVLPVDVKPEDVFKIVPINFKFAEFELNLKGLCEDCN